MCVIEREREREREREVEERNKVLLRAFIQFFKSPHIFLWTMLRWREELGSNPFILIFLNCYFIAKLYFQKQFKES